MPPVSLPQPGPWQDESRHILRPSISWLSHPLLPVNDCSNLRYFTQFKTQFFTFYNLITDNVGTTGKGNVFNFLSVCGMKEGRTRQEEGPSPSLLLAEEERGMGRGLVSKPLIGLIFFKSVVVTLTKVRLIDRWTYTWSFLANVSLAKSSAPLRWHHAVYSGLSRSGVSTTAS